MRRSRKDVDVPSHAMVKDIPEVSAPFVLPLTQYLIILSLQWVISETMRIHSTSAMGLAREIPEGTNPIVIAGQTFHVGDVLSVQGYADPPFNRKRKGYAEEFVPERWEHLTARQKAAFIPSATVRVPVSAVTSLRWNCSALSPLSLACSNSSLSKRGRWRPGRASCASLLACKLDCVAASESHTFVQRMM